MAALTRLLDATAFAKATAWASRAAPFTFTANVLVAPSPSATIFLANSRQTKSRASLNSANEGLTPLTPLASANTQSLVDMSPSTEIMLKLLPTACFNAAFNAAASMTASEQMTANMVAMLG